MNKIYKISLISLLSVCSLNTTASARINVKSNSRSYADAYNQVAAIRYQQEYADAATAGVTTSSDTGNLPVAVDDKKLAAEILNNTSSQVTRSDLEKCAMIYPNGVFRWGIPESGVRRTPVAQCVAVVELRDANTKEILATTTIAAGDTMKCNVDAFPESSYSYDLKYGKKEVPADAAPTIEEVEAVLNQEQKQNAGFKIAAAAILSGVAGNFLAPKPAGDTKLLGTSSTQLQDTAIGAVAGAGIMAASTYSGKVAGDTIKSTAVNAATGMVVGNMLAGANETDGVLETTKCEIKDMGERDCIVGNVSVTSSSSFADWKEKQKLFKSTQSQKCTEGNASADSTVLIKKDGTTLLICNSSHECCNQVKNDLVNISVASNNGSSTYYLKSLTDSIRNNHLKKYTLSSDEDEQKDKKYIELDNSTNSTNGEFYEVVSASYAEKKIRAYAVFDHLPIKALGYNSEDWETLENKCHPTYYERNVSDGTSGERIKADEGKGLVFTPSLRNASDGSLIDISNEARAKGTLVGTAAGGALGGLAGYQGAKSEITERWTAAVRAYDDSLSNFACTTGGRFLATYNSYVDIPELKKDE